MTLGRAFSVGLNAFRARAVEVQANTSRGTRDSSSPDWPTWFARGARPGPPGDRQPGGNFPELKVVVALAPANMPKAGPGFDLAMAVSIVWPTRMPTTSCWRPVRCSCLDGLPSASSVLMAPFVRCAGCCPACSRPGAPVCAGGGPAGEHGRGRPGVRDRDPRSDQIR